MLLNYFGDTQQKTSTAFNSGLPVQGASGLSEIMLGHVSRIIALHKVRKPDFTLACRIN